MTKALFTGIQSELMKRISKSSSSIYVAVAWFTNEELLYSLQNALERGVKVSVMINDDLINRNSVALDFQPFIDNGGELYLYPQGKGLMHNKFCLIDDNWCVSGSYNWTYRAELHHFENVIMTDNAKVCEDFQSYFDSLAENCTKQEHWNRMRLTNSRINAIEGVYDNLIEELEAMPSSKEVEDLQKSIKAINNSNQARLFSTSNPHDKTRRLLANISLTCREDDAVIIVEKGTILPTSNKLPCTTKEDNQTILSGNLTFGTSTSAIENIFLGNLTIEDLPEKEAGKVRVLNRVQVSRDGEIRYQRVCPETGKEVECLLQLPDNFYYERTTIPASKHYGSNSSSNRHK